MLLATLERWITCAMLACIASAQAAESMPAAVAAPGANPALAAFFDAEWETSLRDYPTSATSVGRKDYDDRWTDLTPTAIARRKAHEAEAVAALERFDPTKLGAQDRLSREMYLDNLHLGLEANRLYGDLPFDGFDDWLILSARDGPHARFVAAANDMTFVGARDYRNYLARLAAIPIQLERTIALMRIGMRSGWMPARDSLQAAPGQLDVFVADDTTANPLYRPFTTMPTAMPADEARALQDAARRALTTHVVPAFRAYRRFIVDEYIPAGRPAISASTLPAGRAYYALAIRVNTGTTYTPEQIRDIGLAEVTRIGRELDAEIAKLGYAGTREAFLTSLRADPRFTYANPEDKLKDYRDIAKRVDVQLPRLFVELPRQPYGIRAMEAYEGDSVDHYTPGAVDGSRAGWFEANVYGKQGTPRYLMESVFLHEAVPGHHLQGARAQELRALPQFRRSYWDTAYGEGWALYVEGLGGELGLYTDPYQRIGRSLAEITRAARLVVDTGIHAFGWTRQQAIDYLVHTAGLRDAVAAAETDRYISWPAQALAYKLGELKIRELRDRAHAALGERFDIRAFHNAILDDGALPLGTLETKMNAWIAERAAGAPTPR